MGISLLSLQDQIDDLKLEKAALKNPVAKQQCQNRIDALKRKQKELKNKKKK